MRKKSDRKIETEQIAEAAIVRGMERAAMLNLTKPADIAGSILEVLTAAGIDLTRRGK